SDEADASCSKCLLCSQNADPNASAGGGAGGNGGCGGAGANSGHGGGASVGVILKGLAFSIDGVKVYAGIGGEGGPGGVGGRGAAGHCGGPGAVGAAYRWVSPGTVDGGPLC